MAFIYLHFFSIISSPVTTRRRVNDGTAHLMLRLNRGASTITSIIVAFEETSFECHTKKELMFVPEHAQMQALFLRKHPLTT